jgi:hypothetical protein
MFLPLQAFTYPYLLDALYAVTCLHKSTLEKQQMRLWFERAIQYQNRGIAAFQPELARITEANGEAAVLFSSLTIMTAFAHIGSGFSDPVANILDVRSYQRGTGTVMQAAGGFKISEGRLERLFLDPDGKGMAMFWDGSACPYRSLEA